MKIKILLGFLGLIMLVFLTGCAKKEQEIKNQVSEPLSVTEKESKETTVSKEEDTEIKADKPLEGDDETTKAINEIDKIISNDQTIDKDAFSDSELGL